MVFDVQGIYIYISRFLSGCPLVTYISSVGLSIGNPERKQLVSYNLYNIHSLELTWKWLAWILGRPFSSTNRVFSTSMLVPGRVSPLSVSLLLPSERNLIYHQKPTRKIARVGSYSHGQIFVIASSKIYLGNSTNYRNLNGNLIPGPSKQWTTPHYL